jgi:spermidine synthase
MNVASLDDAASVRSTPVGGGVKTLVYGFFFLSGAVSLIYQVVWVRILSPFFGSDVYSAAATLSVFMGGLALGSWAASRLAYRIRRPLLVYGICEIVTSLAALAVPYLLEALHGAYQQAYLNSFESHPWIYSQILLQVLSANGESSFAPKDEGLR